MANSPYPFIYVCSLTRTGSTLVSGTLTSLPHTFIFQEPHIGKNIFQLPPGSWEPLREAGFDLARFVSWRNRVAFVQRRLRAVGYRQDYMVRVLKEQLAADIGPYAAQIGVKEVRHRGWQNYVRHFPDMRVVVTGRDPRDIYLSIHQRWQKGITPKRRQVDPQLIAAELNAEFAMQRALMAETEHHCIRYEDFCTDETVLERVKQFVQTPAVAHGNVTQFLSHHADRTYEADKHGGQISHKSVGRWRRETDEALAAAAQATFDLMPDYTAFWGYPAS